MNEKKEGQVEWGLVPQIRIIVVLALAISTRAWTTDFAGGTGEANDPYQIATAEQLIGLGEDLNLYDRYFLLIADVDLAEYTFTQAVIAPRWRVGGRGRGGSDWQGTAFSGCFNGNGFLIRNLRMQGDEYLGLFGWLGSGACIIRVALLDCEISGQSDYIGGLAGKNDAGLIVGSRCTGSVIGDDNGAGGLVGDNSGVILGCSNSATVHGSAGVGGLVGTNQGVIISSYSNDLVIGFSGVGALVGNNQGDIISCYATGAVDGRREVGGLTGNNWGGIICSYSTGIVSGHLNSGGLVGVGDDFLGSVVSSFWNTQSSGLETSAGGTGLTANEMQDGQIFMDAGWDFGDEISNGTSDYWQMPEHEGPPVLSMFTSNELVLPEGKGSPEEPFLITTASDLGSVWHRPLAHYRLGTDVDLLGISWACAVIPWFGGHFDGNGFCIRNLNIQGGAYLGLFGQIGSGAQVHDLGLLDADIAGNREHIGVLAGSNQSSLIACYSSGTVSGRGDVGGLAGHNLGNITGSNSAVTVSAERYAGGLVGSNQGDITRSYSIGMVSGSTRVGGLVGSNSGNITRTYSASVTRGDSNVGGLVGSNRYGKVSSSFWDIQASGWDISAGGTGLTSSQMQDHQTFKDAGWDFVGESTDGASDIWTMPEQGAYPMLSLFHGHGPQQPAGLGTAHDPFLLTNANELSSVWYRPLAHYRLGANIDLVSTSWTVPVVPWFGGHFDGNGLHIQNLHVQGVDYLGLFGKLASTAQVHDLGIMDVNTVGTDYLGSLAGINQGSIVDTYSSGMVSGQSNVGGLVGVNNSDVTNSNSSATVTGESHVGDLVGTNGGSIFGSYSSGTVSGQSDVAGLVGKNNGDITNSYSKSTVSGEANVGGLVGENSENITNSFSTSIVNGLQSVGGLTGENSGDVTNSYSTGTVSGRSEVGGLVGRLHGSVVSSFSTGAVSGQSDVGGLVGYSWSGQVTRSFWDIQSSGWDISAGGTGLMTTDMTDPRAYFEARWYFPDVWMVCEGWEYPRLQWENVTCSD